MIGNAVTAVMVEIYETFHRNITYASPLSSDIISYISDFRSLSPQHFCLSIYKHLHTHLYRKSCLRFIENIMKLFISAYAYEATIRRYTATQNNNIRSIFIYFGYQNFFKFIPLMLG